jgi:hypothetical protein
MSETSERRGMEACVHAIRHKGWMLHGLGQDPLHGLWWCELYNLDAKRLVEVAEHDTPAGAMNAALALVDAQPSPTR